MGEAPDGDPPRRDAEDVETRRRSPTDKLAYLTQTTLSVDDDGARSSPRCGGASRKSRRPPKDDICYATTNRQRTVKAMLPEIDLLLVLGSRNSSNSNRLVETARAGGIPAHLIDDENGIDANWLEGVEVVGITSGASAPESLVRRVVTWFRERGVADVRTHRTVLENVSFKLPLELRRRGSRVAPVRPSRPGAAGRARREPPASRP